jgi:hypothetical protein
MAIACSAAVVAGTVNPRTLARDSAKRTAGLTSGTEEAIRIARARSSSSFWR